MLSYSLPIVQQTFEMSKIEFLAPYWEIEKENLLEESAADTTPEPVVSKQPADKVLYQPDLQKHHVQLFPDLLGSKTEKF